MLLLNCKWRITQTLVHSQTWKVGYKYKFAQEEPKWLIFPVTPLGRNWCWHKWLPTPTGPCVGGPCPTNVWHDIWIATTGYKTIFLLNSVDFSEVNCSGKGKHSLQIIFNSNKLKKKLFFAADQWWGLSCTCSATSPIVSTIPHWDKPQMSSVARWISVTFETLPETLPPHLFLLIGLSDGLIIAVVLPLALLAAERN